MKDTASEIRPRLTAFAARLVVSSTAMTATKQLYSISEWGDGNACPVLLRCTNGDSTSRETSLIISKMVLFNGH